MTALPNAATTDTLDDPINDDPRQSQAELKAAVDALNQIRSYLEGLFGTDGTKPTARSTLGLGAAALEAVQAVGSGALLRTDGDGSGLSGVSAFSTGDIRPSFRASAPSGWILIDGSSLGNTGSGATFTGTAYQALYTFLWDNLDDTAAPVTGGRGASASADWTANKALTMPDGRGRSFIGAGQGAGLTNRILGCTGGQEDAIVPTHNHGAGSMSAASGGSHSHNVRLTGGSSTGTTIEAPVDPDGFGPQVVPTSDEGSHSHSLSGDTADAGESATDKNLGPWIAGNWEIKL